MMMKTTLSLFCSLAGAALLMSSAHAQTVPTRLAKPTECKVKDPELQGKYVGECSPLGWAQGKGTATGKVAIYTGDFVDGEKHGYGVKYWNATGNRYVGQYKKELPDGLGMFAWGEKTEFSGYQYTGQYKQDKRDGQGIFVWPNGESYAGKWVADGQTEGYTPIQIRQTLESDVKTGTVRPR